MSCFCSKPSMAPHCPEQEDFPLGVHTRRTSTAFSKYSTQRLGIRASDCGNTPGVVDEMICPQFSPVHFHMIDGEQTRLSHTEEVGLGCVIHFAQLNMGWADTGPVPSQGLQKHFTFPFLLLTLLRSTMKEFAPESLSAWVPK